jgi:heme A synthase
MYELGPLEIAFVLIYLTGIACAVVGALTKRFDLRETVGALIFSLGVPLVGSLVAIVMLIIKFSEGRRDALKNPICAGARR